jgi:hypothetical protein
LADFQALIGSLDRAAQVRRLLADGVDAFAEFGPGPTLFSSKIK